VIVVPVAFFTLNFSALHCWNYPN